ncbi:sucrase-isomaltase, intestinal-like [Galendromus occidentalis]|uniref:Maltase n=1 Tax=Galendromus occidentalis TaxID=34638 RepID=A0AAJ7WJ92_9ACAR|nr:sucrase-isomaltase, intestinal-like [Galendromus occidentalis]
MENDRLAGDSDNPLPLGRCYNGEVLVRWNSRQSLKSTGRIRRRRRFRSQVKDRRLYNGIVGSVALILALVAVCVPVYYAVLRRYLSEIDFTPLGERKLRTPWKKACPKSFFEDFRRYDCYPDKKGEVSKQDCLSRGCCYREATNARVPSCFLPTNKGYRHFSGPNPVCTRGYEYILDKDESPLRYGDEAPYVTLRVEHQTTDRLRIKISDPKDERAEVPFPSLPIHHENSNASMEAYAVSYNKIFPFSDKQDIIIRRSATGTTVFDTSAGALIFSGQFIEITTLLPSHNVYGIGEHMKPGIKMDLNYKTYPLFNAETYPPNGMQGNRHGSHPFYVVIENDGNAHGVLLMNSSPMEIHAQPAPSLTFRVIGGVLDLYIFMGPAPEDVLRQYHSFIGRPFMPPYWALGYHLGRWGFKNDYYVQTQQEAMRKQSIPQDGLSLDLDIRGQHESFNLDTNGTYKELPAIVEYHRKRDYRVLLTMEPALSVQHSSFMNAFKRKILVRNSFEGTVKGLSWAGEVGYPDFLNEASWKWLADEVAVYRMKLTFDGIFLTNNEPVDFTNKSFVETECINDNLNFPHYKPATRGSFLFDGTLCMDSNHIFKGHSMKHYNVHNVYGHFSAIAFYNAMKSILNGTRPLIVSRSTFLGTGRYAGHWFDELDSSSWRDMRWTLRAALEMNMFGIPLVGGDVCGHFEDSPQELCYRWTQLGAMLPLMRNHNADEAASQDPPAYGTDFSRAVREIIRLRYQLIPFLYTLFYKSHAVGGSVIRPLSFNFPNDRNSIKSEEQLMWGDALMFSPALYLYQVSKEVYLPPGIWYDFFSGERVSTSGSFIQIPVPLYSVEKPLVAHVRGGRVIPLQNPALNTHSSRKNPLSLIVAYDDTFGSEGQLYWDDGETLDSFERGDYIVMNIVANKTALSLTVMSGKCHLYAPFYNLVIHKIRLLGMYKKPSRVLIDGKYALFPSQIHWMYRQNIMELSRLLVPLSRNSSIVWDFD